VPCSTFPTSLTWILFLRILDEREAQEVEEAEAVGEDYTPSLESPYRLFDEAPALYDVVLTTLPFGGEEEKEAQTYSTKRTGPPSPSAVHRPHAQGPH
jgi:hypothetical protein